MGRVIDADICLKEAWQNFYKLEEEHQKNIDGYDIMRDQFYEQSGFECCQQTIVNAPTVEAIPREEVRQFIENIQKIKDNHNEYGEPINYGTICGILIEGYRLLDKYRKGKDGNDD